MEWNRRLLSVGLAAIGGLSVVGCVAQQPQPQYVGHVADGVYILNERENAYTCAEYAGAIDYAFRQATDKVNDGNRAAIMTIVGNAVALGMGSIPRNFNLGSAQRFEGRQAMTEALTLNEAAMAKGCPDAKVVEKFDEFLGEGSIDKIIEQRQEDNVDPVLEEERDLKTRVR